MSAADAATSAAARNAEDGGGGHPPTPSLPRSFAVPRGEIVQTDSESRYRTRGGVGEEREGDITDEGDSRDASARGPLETGGSRGDFATETHGAHPEEVAEEERRGPHEERRGHHHEKLERDEILRARARRVGLERGG